MSKKKIKALTARILKIEKALAGLLRKPKAAKIKPKRARKIAARPAAVAQKPVPPKPKAKRKAAKPAKPASFKPGEAIVAPGTPVAIL